MRKKPSAESGFFNSRTLFSLGLCLCGLVLAMIGFAANPPAGSISVNSSPISWVGTAAGTGSADGESSCVEGVSCDTFTLTVDPLANWTGKKIEIRIQQAASYDDTDLVIHKTNNTGPIVSTSGNGAGITEVGYINPSSDGTGVFTVHVIYFATVPGDQYHGSAEVVPLSPAPPPAATVDTANKIGYEIFEAPGVMTPVTVTTGPTVEWLGRNAGEPSGGVNWQSTIDSVNGVTQMQSDLETLFVTWNTPANGGGAIASWANRPGPTQVVIDSDPIGFTDIVTGRTFAAELSATSPTCKISFTDNDGQTWAPSSGPLGSGIDHETIGAGVYALPLPSPSPSPVAGLLHAVYYCSQDLVAAFCLRSDNGGATWGPPVQTYTTECGGLHGHVKVSPKDGTVFLPNKDCSGAEAAVVSENNGVSWNIRPVANGNVTPGSSQSDPAISIDSNGRAYFAMAANDSAAVVAISDNHGVTWNNIVNTSSALGLQNIRYPAATAGETNRAAIAFMGTTTPGDANSSNFNGVWHMYVSHTFDGGATWTTSDVTPNLPVQRGNIWTGGGANIGRNLLDFFDVNIDKKGRVEVQYVNGCSGGNCEQSSATATGNAYTATAAIARQSSGKRMLSANDGLTAATTAPGMPYVTTRRIGNVTHLSWSEADTGGSTITGYQILRSTISGAETLLASVGANINRYDDYSAADSSKTYYYKVIATNGVGPSAPNNEVAAPYVGDTCNGVIIHRNDPTHPEAAGGGAGQVPELLIDYVALGEPATPIDSFMFQMKVTDLNPVPPTARWRMVWDSFSSPGQQWYVGMTSSNGTITFEYGSIATAVVGLVVGVPQETLVGSCTASPGTSCTIPGAGAASQYNVDGTITIYVPKAAVGNPQPGDLLGAVNGRTFADTTAFERSTQLIDHTFVKAQTDNTYPAATYTVVGNGVCAVQPTLAQSRKTHSTAGTFNVTLPLTGAYGIEDRTDPTAPGTYLVVVTFPSVPTVTSYDVTPGQGGTAHVASHSIVGNQVFINLDNVSDPQLLTVDLFGVGVAGKTGDVIIPMGVLIGDVNASKRTDNGDAIVVRNQSGTVPIQATFRSDVNISGRIDNGDAIVIRNNSGESLP
jgi:hypothetical protein